MDKIILGLLMLKRLTVYEIRNIIRQNFKDICSDSLGSIQAAIKKLLAAQMLTCSEYVEKSVNKKQYSITDRGRGAFSEWIQSPALLAGGKNMELGKLLFMGLVPAEKCLLLVDEMIASLEKKLSFLLEVQAVAKVEGKANKERVIAYLREDSEYDTGIQQATQNADLGENINRIGYFQFATLQYGIASLTFHIQWLQTLKEKMGPGGQVDMDSMEMEEGLPP
ncbi:MAG: PadR family transcriptional regulator [Cystobacterineae bacterium]|nr:PadR family transcriptional regulator [Cystobacterineae bacterium]